MGKKRREKLARRQSKSAAAATAPSRKPAPALMIAAIAFIAILAVAAFAIVRNRQHAAAADVAATAAPQASPGVHYPSQGHQGHSGESISFIEHFKYSSDPPTSGAHREIFSTAFINDKPLPKYVQVHLLEHGNVLVQYNCFSCPDVVNALTVIAHKFDDRLIPIGSATPSPTDIQQAEEQGEAVIVAPYDAMSSKIALTAWTRLETLDNIDVPAIYAFANAYLHNADNIKQ